MGYDDAKRRVSRKFSRVSCMFDDAPGAGLGRSGAKQTRASNHGHGSVHSPAVQPAHGRPDCIVCFGAFNVECVLVFFFWGQGRAGQQAERVPCVCVHVCVRVHEKLALAVSKRKTACFWESVDVAADCLAEWIRCLCGDASSGGRCTFTVTYRQAQAASQCQSEGRKVDRGRASSFLPSRPQKEATNHSRGHEPINDRYTAPKKQERAGAVGSWQEQGGPQCFGGQEQEHEEAVEAPVRGRCRCNAKARHGKCTHAP